MSNFQNFHDLLETKVDILHTSESPLLRNKNDSSKKISIHLEQGSREIHLKNLLGRKTVLFYQPYDP